MKKCHIAKKYFLLLPYNGKRADKIIKLMNKTKINILRETVITQSANTRRKLSTCFQIKDKSKFDHWHNLGYHAKCHSEFCDKNCIVECGSCIAERVKNRNERDYKSHILKHSLGK